MWHSERHDMGVHISYPGSTINAYIDNGISAFDIARWHVQRGDRCSRIDLAIDAHDSALNIAGLYALIETEAYELPFKRKSALLSSSDGITLYVGSRTSDLFLRIYDKGQERKLDHDWKRVELETKGKRAMFFVHLLVSQGQEAVGNTARKVIKGMADFPDETFQQIIGDMPMTIAKGENRDKDTKTWLLTSVAPAMGRYIQKSGDTKLTEQFLAIVAAFCD